MPKSGTDSDGSNCQTPTTIYPSISDISDEISHLFCILLGETGRLLIDKRLDSDGDYLKQLKEAIENLHDDGPLFKTLRAAQFSLKNVHGKIVKANEKNNDQDNTTPTANPKKRKRARVQSPPAAKLKNIPDIICEITAVLLQFNSKAGYLDLRESFAKKEKAKIYELQKFSDKFTADLLKAREELTTVVARMTTASNAKNARNAGNTSKKRRN